jgi:chromosome segregation ATPase
VAALNAPGVDNAEIGKEIFGLAGYKDGRRFMVQEKENAKIQQVMQQAQQMVQQAQQELAQRSQELDQQEQTLKALQGKIENDAVKLNGSKNELALKEQLAVTKIQSAAKSAASELSRLTTELENSIAEVTERMASLEIATDADVEDLTQLFAQVILGQEQIAAIINQYGTVQ